MISSLKMEIQHVDWPTEETECDEQVITEEKYNDPFGQRTNINAEKPTESLDLILRELPKHLHIATVRCRNMTCRCYLVNNCQGTGAIVTSYHIYRGDFSCFVQFFLCLQSPC